MILRELYCGTVPPRFSMEMRVPWTDFSRANDFKSGPHGISPQEHDYNLALFIQVLSINHVKTIKFTDYYLFTVRAYLYQERTN